MPSRQRPLCTNGEFIVDSLPEVKINEITFVDLHPILSLHQRDERINKIMNRFIRIELLNISTATYRKPAGSRPIIDSQKAAEFFSGKSITKHWTNLETFCIRSLFFVYRITLHPPFVITQPINCIHTFHCIVSAPWKVYLKI